MATAETWSLYGSPSPVDALAAEIAELRPLPESAMRIARLTTDDRFSAQDLATLVAQDSAITARLLRLANSAYYGFSRNIGTVRDAVVLVGLRAVRAVVLVACVMDPGALAPRRTSVDTRANWRFSVSVGVLAELLAREEGLEAEAAFTAGVLHNIGIVALDQYRPESLRAAMHRARTQGRPLHELEREVFGFTDADLGGALAERWGFPVDLVAAIRDHARPLDELPERQSLTACVLRARLIARSYGLPDGLHGPTTPDERGSDLTPSIAEQLMRAGGMPAILSRADAFVDATVA
ncbi:MAG: HDOD domain-containing protein [Chloroflexi bacterium]|nr:HDOD domain-containing protein [Chloroflexota bacterium]